jgi:hypothetical protein
MAAGNADAGLANAGAANRVGELVAGLAGVAAVAGATAYVMKAGLASVTESPKFA